MSSVLDISNSPHGRLTSVSSLYLILTNLLTHVFNGNDQRRALPVRWYLWTRLEEHPAVRANGRRPLSEVFDKLHVDTQKLVVNMIMRTPYASSWGLMGKDPDPALVPALKAFTEEKKKSFHDEGFPTLLKEFAASHPQFFVALKDKKQDDAKMQQWALKEMATHGYELFSVNKQAEKLIPIIHALLDLNRLTIPNLARKDTRDHHLSLFKSAFMGVEVALPCCFVEEMATKHLEFKDFFSTAIVFQLLYEETQGSYYLPNLKKIGWNLGFRGSPHENYDYLHRYNGLLGTDPIFSYPQIGYERVGEVTSEFSAPPKVKTPNGPTPKFTQKATIYQNGTQGTHSYRNVEARKMGTYFVDLEHLKHRFKTTEMLSSYDLELPNLPRQIRFMSPISQYDMTLKNSVFNEKAQRRVFCSLPQNPIFKPDTSKFQKSIDKRWEPIFDRYLATNFSLAGLAEVAKDDYTLFYKLKPSLEAFAKVLAKKKQDPNAHDYEVTTSRQFDTDESLDEPHHYEVREKLERSDKNLYSLYQSYLPSWLETFSDKTKLKEAAYGFSPIRVFLAQEQPGKGKRRTLCQSSIEQKLFEKISNRFCQVILQKINMDHLDNSISNYLPGQSTALYTMERFKKYVSKRDVDVDVFNLDVRSCFDSLNLKHKNFLECLDHGLDNVGELLSPEARSFLELTLKGYLYGNYVETKKFKFKVDKGVNLEDGALPTGFVLAPTLWLTLTLPSVVSLAKDVAAKKVLAFDLCGDDLFGLSPVGLSAEDKTAIIKPYVELAQKLDLKFHFFKNYRDGFLPIAEKHVGKFKDNPWVEKFPLMSVPLYHAGAMLHRRRLVETVTSFNDNTAIHKIRMAVAKKIREGEALLTGAKLVLFGARSPTIAFDPYKSKALKVEEEQPSPLERRRKTIGDLLHGERKVIVFHKRDRKLVLQKHPKIKFLSDNRMQKEARFNIIKNEQTHRPKTAESSEAPQGRGEGKGRASPLSIRLFWEVPEEVA